VAGIEGKGKLAVVFRVLWETMLNLGRTDNPTWNRKRNFVIEVRIISVVYSYYFCSFKDDMGARADLPEREITFIGEEILRCPAKAGATTVT
jgi:hypothetical protein